MTDNFPQTLPASWYCGAAQFAREEKAIFAQNWSVLARTEQLSTPGDYVAGQIARWPVFVIRGEDGTLRGFHNVCRHRAGPLFDPGAGRCNLSYGVRCRYHGWTFDANGALLKAPGFETNGGFRPEDHGLFPVRVEEWNGLLFGCLDAEAPALLSWLGDIPAIAEEFPKASEMRYYREVVAEGEANWKAYGDNSVEGYHLPFVHSQLNQATLKIELEPHENGKFVGFRIAYGPWGNHPPSRGYWIYKFPCLLLHFSEYDFNLEQIYPLSPRKIRLVHWFWRPDDTTPQGDYDEFTEGWQKTMAEDMEICAAVQQNLEVGAYERGVLSPEKEPGTIFFQRLLGEALADAAG